MIHASLFSGIGGPEIAADMMGWRNAFHCEINPFGRKVLDYWYPDSKSYEDITRTSFKEWRGRIDVLTGGFPCQPFSMAGKRKGADDNRYLWPEMLRVIDEVRPTWVVGENVAGIATMVEGGHTTEVGCQTSLFEEDTDIHEYRAEYTFTIERICSDLEGIGYSVQPILLPACAVGAPHRRDRFFFLAYNVADTDRDSLDGVAGVDGGTEGKEGIQERHEVQEPSVASPVRQEDDGCVDAQDTKRSGLVEYEDEESGRVGEFGFSGSGGGERIRGEARLEGSPSPDSSREQGYGLRLEQPKTSEPQPRQFRGGGRQDGIGEQRTSPDPSDLFRDGCEPYERSGSEEVSQFGDGGRSEDGGHPLGERWRAFPSVSPIYRGNDGIPFDVDCLSIPFSRWRVEALKAYGNAIVPQVMYEIFRAIEKAGR